jgi:hypothetical protein
MDTQSTQSTENTPRIRMPPPVMPGAITCTISQAMGLTGRTERWVYHALADGRLKGVKSDKRTLIMVASIYDYIAGLPAVDIKPTYRPPLKKAKRRRPSK